MEYMQHRLFYKNSGGEVELFKFWVADDGEIDVDNLPCASEVVKLIQAIRVYGVQSEFTGRVEDDE